MPPNPRVSHGTPPALHVPVTPHDIEDLEDDLATTTFDRAEILAALMARSPGLQVPPPPPRRPTPIPPPLPTVLRKRISYGDEEWLASLPAESRSILEAASRPARPWPHAERIPGAVCTPIL